MLSDKQREQNKRIGELTDSQAKIALRAIASDKALDKALDEALDIAETY